MPREEVAITIGAVDQATRRRGEYFGYWSDVEIKRSIDTYSTVVFNAPFEPQRREFRETFRPFTFQRLECLISLETIVTGFSLGIDPSVDWNGRSVAVTGYSKPAVLGDVSMPPLPVGKSYQYDGLNLRNIAQRVCDPFGIKVDFRSDDVKPFKKVKLEIDKKPQEFLVDLAKQRELVLTDTPEGDLLLWKSIDPGKPVWVFEEGKQPLIKITPSFSPQEYFSELTGYGKKKRGHGEARWPAANPWLEGVLRPKVFKLEDSERADVPEATRAELGRMFARCASYKIENIPTWRDPQGELWRPNTTIIGRAPGAMIYRETEFLIRDVTLKQTANEETATLEVCLPGAFSGKVPDSLPWLEPDV